MLWVCRRDWWESMVLKQFAEWDESKGSSHGSFRKLCKMMGWTKLPLDETVCHHLQCCCQVLHQRDINMGWCHQTFLLDCQSLFLFQLLPNTMPCISIHPLKRFQMKIQISLNVLFTSFTVLWMSHLTRAPEWDFIRLSFNTSTTARFVECMTNSCPADKLSHLRCVFSLLLQSYNSDISYYSNVVQVCKKPLVPHQITNMRAWRLQFAAWK